MSAASSSFAVCRRALALPLARCPTCKEKVRMYISTTEKHDGWVFYKCQKHGVTCDFRRWELEYVEHLVEKQYLTGDAAVDAIGAMEERRKELLKAQELFYMNGSVINVKKVLKKNDSANFMTTDDAWERAGDAHEDAGWCCGGARSCSTGGDHAEEVKMMMFWCC